MFFKVICDFSILTDKVFVHAGPRYALEYILGAEYELKNYLALRGAYTYEEGITSDADRTTALTGPSAGISVQIPINKENNSIFAIDYSYRATNPFQGTHTMAVRLTF